MDDSVKLYPESFLFKIVTLLGTGFFTGFFIANAIFYFRIKDKPPTGISQKEASNLFWINVILATISGILFLWTFFRFFITPEKRKKIITQATTQPYTASFSSAPNVVQPTVTV